MVAGKAVGRRTGPKPSFSRDDVVDAAILIGMDRFTIAQVAQAVGVVTSAVYRRFDSRDDLLDACLARAAQALTRPVPHMGWQEVCRLWAEEIWRICEDFPGLARTLYSYAPAFAHAGEVVAAYVSALTADGRSIQQSMFALDFLGDTVLSCRLGVEMMRAVDEVGESGLSRVMKKMAADHPMQPEDSWSDRGFVDVKVEFIVRGLEQHWPEM